MLPSTLLGLLFRGSTLAPPSAGFLVILLLAPGQSVHGQEAPLLGEACEPCEVVATPVAVFGDPEGGGLIESESLLMDVDEDGRFYVISRPATQVQVFGPEGTFLQSVGGEGDGPGEFRWAQGLHIDEAGRLLVIDRLVGRISIFDSGLNLVRTIPLTEPAAGFELFSLPGDSILMSGYDFSPQYFGTSAHVVAPDGRRVRSFGEPTYPIASTRDPFDLLRTITPRADGELWIAGWSRFQIERWSLGGDRLDSMRWSDPAFQPPEPVPNRPPPPRPALVSVQEDSNGVLWAVANVPGANWAEAVRPSGADPHGFAMEDPDLWTDAKVTAIDPEEHVVLATARFEQGQFTNLFGEQLIGRVSWDAESESLKIHVMRLKLADHPGGDTW